MRKIYVNLLLIPLCFLSSCNKQNDLTPVENEIRIISGSFRVLEPLGQVYMPGKYGFEDDVEYDVFNKYRYSFGLLEKVDISDTQFVIYLNRFKDENVNVISDDISVTYTKNKREEFICNFISMDLPYGDFGDFYGIDVGGKTIIKPSILNDFTETFYLEEYLVDRGFTQNYERVNEDKYKPFIDNNINYEWKCFDFDYLHLNYCVTSDLDSGAVLVKYDASIDLDKRP